MEESTLYDLLSDGILRNWRKSLEETESETYLFKSEQEVLKKLEATLDEKNKELLTSYYLSVEDKVDYINYNLKIKILNLGIKIGMELQKAFIDIDFEE